MPSVSKVAAISDHAADISEPVGAGAGETSFQNDLGISRSHASPHGADGPKYEVNEDLLDEVIHKHMSAPGKGKPVAGIPGTKPDAEKRSITVMNAKTGQIASTGDLNHRFSQQSMSKPTAMALAIKLMGGDDAYRQYVGVEASGRAYNAPDLLPDGRPFNSSVNTGALATWVLIHAHTPPGKNAFDLYLDQMKEMTGNPYLTVNEPMAKGEFAFRPAGGGESGNQKLMKVLDQAGLMKVLEKQNGGRPLTAEQKQDFANQAFRDYCRACGVMVNTQDMAKVAAVYRNGGVRMDPEIGAATQVLPKQIADFVHRSNTVSGSYDESGTQFAKNDFGGKTGVDGGIFGSLHRHPDMVVATHHSDLNAAGNSGEGQKWIGTLNKMDLAFPQKAGLTQRLRTTFRPNGATGANSQSSLRKLSAGELGPSPRELDEKLRAETPDQSLGAIRTKLRKLTDNDKGFYMKVPDASKPKDPLLGARKLLTAQDQHGNWKNYHLAKGDHQLHKVVVTDGGPQLSLNLPDLSLDLSSDSFSPNLAVPAHNDLAPDVAVAIPLAKDHGR